MFSASCGSDIAEHNFIVSFQIFLDAGAQVNPVLRTSKNIFMTPLDCALQRGFRSTAKYLQLHGGVPAGRLGTPQRAQIPNGHINLRMREDVTPARNETTDSERENDDLEAKTKKKIRRKHKHERRKGSLPESEAEKRKSSSGERENVSKPEKENVSHELPTQAKERKESARKTHRSKENVTYSSEVKITNNYGGINIEKNGEIIIKDSGSILKDAKRDKTQGPATHEAKFNAEARKEHETTIDGDTTKKPQDPATNLQEHLPNLDKNDADNSEGGTKNEDVEHPKSKSVIDENIEEIKSLASTIEQTAKSITKEVEHIQQNLQEEIKMDYVKQPDQQSVLSSTSVEDVDETNKSVLVEAAVHEPPKVKDDPHVESRRNEEVEQALTGELEASGKSSEAVPKHEAEVHANDTTTQDVKSLNGETKSTGKPDTQEESVDKIRDEATQLSTVKEDVQVPDDHDTDTGIIEDLKRDELTGDVESTEQNAQRLTRKPGDLNEDDGGNISPEAEENIVTKAQTKGDEPREEDELQNGSAEELSTEPTRQLFNDVNGFIEEEKPVEHADEQNESTTKEVTGVVEEDDVKVGYEDGSDVGVEVDEKLKQDDDDAKQIDDDEGTKQDEDETTARDADVKQHEAEMMHNNVETSPEGVTAINMEAKEASGKAFVKSKKDKRTDKKMGKEKSPKVHDGSREQHKAGRGITSKEKLGVSETIKVKASRKIKKEKLPTKAIEKILEVTEKSVIPLDDVFMVQKRARSSNVRRNETEESTLADKLSSGSSESSTPTKKHKSFTVLDVAKTAEESDFNSITSPVAHKFMDKDRLAVESYRRSKIPTPVRTLRREISTSDKHLDRVKGSYEDLTARVPSLPNLMEGTDRKRRQVSIHSRHVMYSDNERSASEAEAEVTRGSFRKKRLKKRMKRDSRSAGSDYESSNVIDSGFEPSPRSSRIPKWRNMTERGVNMSSVTQTIQSNIRRFVVVLCLKSKRTETFFHLLAKYNSSYCS